ncbi:MAG: class I SAM-dependent RNA methyltransferase, partial [Muribaculaceae bacterium]|nr:class I SAM-dependent RNA methyltransferase [Muribaculaceae bacterium]
MPELQNFKIEKVAAEGKSLGHWNDLVVFVPYGAPGDEVTVKLLRKRHNYAEGVITNLTKPSQLRVEPKCEHFGVCGGCKWQHLPYEYQLENKRQQVVDALERIAKVELPEINPILGSKEIYGYRNKLEFTFSNKSWLTQEQLESGVEFADRNAAGFHIPGAFDKVLDIKHCYLQGDINNRVRLFIRSYCVEKGYGFYDLRAQQGFIRMIMLRTASTGEIMLVVVFGENNKKAIDEIM